MSESSADTSIDLGNGFGALLVGDAPPAKCKPSAPKPRTNECKGSRVALNGYPMDTPCPKCGRAFEPINFLVRDNGPAFPPHMPPSAKENRQAAAARGRAERERRIAADRINSVRAAVAFKKWCGQ